jgi:hypothetical protein
MLTQDVLYTLADGSHDPIDGNASFEIVGSSPVHLQAAIAMLMARLHKATHMKVAESSIIFSNGIGAEKDLVKLPIDLDVIGVVQMAENWLRNLESSKLPRKPDHDGSNSKGWKVSKKGYWGDIEVSFHWCEHHK